MNEIDLDKKLKKLINEYLPFKKHNKNRPFVTLTFAQSLDSKISIKNKKTVLSGKESTLMTHYLRSKHDGILIGWRTVVLDDPQLTCRYLDEKIIKFQPRPIIIDLDGKWKYCESKICRLNDQTQLTSPIIVISESTNFKHFDAIKLKEHNGMFLIVPKNITTEIEFWNFLLSSLFALNIKSLMIEGGARIINGLLDLQEQYAKVLDSLIITLVPKYLGKDGVQVSPKCVQSLSNVKWWCGDHDSILFNKF